MASEVGGTEPVEESRDGLGGHDPGDREDELGGSEGTARLVGGPDPGSVAPGEEDQPAEQPDHEQVDKPEEHDR